MNGYEVVIIGGGPAGLTAGIYTARARLKGLLIETGIPGGQITESELVENFPGFPEGVSGFDLGQMMHQQATKFGLEIIQAEVTGLEIQDKTRLVQTTQGDFPARAVIIASGSQRRKLGVPGELELSGRGVSYCATCDGAFFRELPVAVVGGSDAALTEALHLAKLASRVTIIHRRRELRAQRILQERAFAEPNLNFLWDTVVDEISGETKVKQLKIRNVKTGAASTLDVAGVFISVGIKPMTDYLKGVLPLDDFGHIITDVTLETSIPGVFAAGDIRQHSAKQAITAAGDGATAAIFAQRFINERA